MLWRVWVVGLGMLVGGSMATGAAISANLIQGGDFESAAYFKNSSSYDGEGTEIGPHRFDQDSDLGKWLAQWGPNSVCGHDGGSLVCGQAGVSTYSDPRRDVSPADGVFDIPFSSMGAMNLSVDPFDPQNHVLENVAFRPMWGQWVTAPVHQAIGPLQFSFDFFQDRWDTGATPATMFTIVKVYGSDVLPNHNQSVLDDSPGDFFHPLGLYDEDQSNGDLLVRWEWRWSYANEAGFNLPQVNGAWQTVSTDDPAFLWDTIGDKKTKAPDVLTVSTDRTYAYYGVVVYNAVYSEGHPYYWQDGGRVVDSFAQAIDNVDLRVWTAILCDMNQSGAVNEFDIAPFITTLTDGRLYTSEADVNQDGAVNNLDIDSFLRTLGAISPGSVASVPEPSMAALWLVSAATLLVRRRA